MIIKRRFHCENCWSTKNPTCSPVPVIWIQSVWYCNKSIILLTQNNCIEIISKKWLLIILINYNKYRNKRKQACDSAHDKRKIGIFTAGYTSHKPVVSMKTSCWIAGCWLVFKLRSFKWSLNMLYSTLVMFFYGSNQ